MDLKVYRSDSRAGRHWWWRTARARDRSSPFMVRTAAGLAARGITAATFDFPYMTAGRKRSRSRRRARSGVARGDRRPRAARSAGCRSSSAASRWAAASRRTSRPRAATGIAGLVFLGYPLHPPGKPSSGATRTCRRSASRCCSSRARRTPSARPTRSGALLPSLQRRDAARGRGRRSLVQGVGTRSAEAGRGARRRSSMSSANGSGPRCRTGPRSERARLAPARLDYGATRVSH